MTQGGFEVRKPAKTWKFSLRWLGPVGLLVVAVGIIGYGQVAGKAFSLGVVDPVDGESPAVFYEPESVPQYYKDAVAELRDQRASQAQPTGVWWREEITRRQNIESILERADKNAGSD